MLNLHVRAPLGRLLAPVGRGLASTGLSPDVITVVGTVGAVAGALFFYPRGQLVLGTAVVTIFVLFDLLDGLLARARGGGSTWGAFLDSSLDRVADAAIFSGLVLWYTGDGDSRLMASLALYCLVAGAVTSYVKARAEGLGMTCDVGFAERSERLIIVLAAVFFGGIAGSDALITVALAALAVASTITVGQRFAAVHSQASGRRLQ